MTRRAIAPCAVARPTRAASRAPALSTAPRSANVAGGSTMKLLSSPLAPVTLLAVADGAPRGLEKYFTNLLQGQADFFSTLGLPEWLVHWGHPGNMASEKELSLFFPLETSSDTNEEREVARSRRKNGAGGRGEGGGGGPCPFPLFFFFEPPPHTHRKLAPSFSPRHSRNETKRNKNETPPLSPPVVLVAMGLYGSGYLGWTIRLSDDEAAVAKAKGLHPKLAVGMAVFFAAGAAGGFMSLLMQGQPLTHSPHFITGSVGLLLLAFQGMLSAFFDDDPGLRGAHAYFGTAILALFVVHVSDFNSGSLFEERPTQTHTHTERERERETRGREEQEDDEEEDEKKMEPNFSPTFFSIRLSIPPQLPSPNFPLQAFPRARSKTAAVSLLALLLCSTSSAQVFEIFSFSYFSSSLVAFQSTRRSGRIIASFSESRASAAAVRFLLASCLPRR